ncbi:hypothetical protein CIPAW_05G048100 [Carya illinoinensis]|uniref:Uncharacterized protein n=1 Tax=Carya illinoinensis TaxID=32201 RepID=A0A8T1QEM0_CARIL|nr:hypothetical protein CIPAW_05G048100 [Carya illinoinensis]
MVTKAASRLLVPFAFNIKNLSSLSFLSSLSLNPDQSQASPPPKPVFSVVAPPPQSLYLVAQNQSKRLHSESRFFLHSHGQSKTSQDQLLLHPLLRPPLAVETLLLCTRSAT